MRHFTSQLLAGVMASLALATAWAEDIDIFEPNPNFAGTAPNILIVVDNGASWGSQLGNGQTGSQAIHQALYQVAMNAPGARLGLMPFVHNNSPRGGQVFFAVKELDEQRTKSLTCRLYNTVPNDMGYCPQVVGSENLAKTNNTPYGLALNEAYRYFKGLSPRSGLGDGVYQKKSNPRGYDASALDGSNRYISPAQANSCSTNIVIVIGTADPDNGENTDAESILRGYGGRLNGDPVVLDPNNFGSSWGDEYARYLRTVDVDPTMEGDQSILTYVIDVFNPGANQNNPFRAARAYYKSMARLGGGSYFAANSAQDVIDAIEDIMNQAQAVNTVFSSVSLPISANVQGTNHNQVYIGMFRPDRNKKPKWLGNLKKYQYQFDPITKVPFLADRHGNEAYNPATGFIRETASSFWTGSSNYWGFTYADSPSDDPDGNLVEKGATGQRLRARSTARNLYTCAGGCQNGNALKQFASTNAAVTSAFDALDPAAGRTVLAWARGEDPQDENGNLNLSEPRSSIHGDVLHSRPAAVNYFRSGTSDSGQDVVVFYGSNDGMFRAVDGATGEELWAFVPEEQFPGLKRLYDNTVVGEQYGSRPYFSDGNVSVVSQDVNNDGRLIHTDGDTVWAFITMRRGGRYLYALDVSNPSAPKFMWKKSYSDTGLAELGQSWSAPEPMFISALGRSEAVLVLGAGYDAAAEDYVPGSGTRPERSQGRGVFMLKAETGELYWHAAESPETGATYRTSVSGMDFSVPSDIAAINYSRGTGNFAERLYFGDTGGNVWRADIASEDPADWSITQLASLGGSSCSATSDADCRKFLYAPSIVRASDGSLALLLGSGDREHPFEESVQNRFYMIKDHGGQQTSVTDADLLDVSDQMTGVSASIDNGWYFDMRSGEKVSGPALTMQGVTYFATNERATYSATSCSSNLGIAREYFVNFADGTIVTSLLSDRSMEAPGGGFLPPPVGVTITDSDGTVWTGIGGLDPKDVGVGQPGARQRTYWHKSVD